MKDKNILACFISVLLAIITPQGAPAQQGLATPPNPSEETMKKLEEIGAATPERPGRPLTLRPGMYVRVDSFSVPEGARSDFGRTSLGILRLLRTLDGYVGEAVLEKREGEAPGQVLTQVAWRDREAQEKANLHLRNLFERRGIDIPRMLQAWGVELRRGDYEVMPDGATALPASK